MTPRLNQEVKNLAFIIDRAPQPVALFADNKNNLVEMPEIVWRRPAAPEIGGNNGTEFQEPATDRFI